MYRVKFTKSGSSTESCTEGSVITVQAVNRDTREEYTAALSEDTIKMSDKKILDILSIEELADLLETDLKQTSPSVAFVVGDASLHMKYTLALNFGAKRREFDMVVSLAKTERDECAVLREIIQDTRKEFKDLYEEVKNYKSIVDDLKQKNHNLMNKRWDRIETLFTNEELELWARENYAPYKTELKNTHSAKYMEVFTKLYGDLHGKAKGYKLNHDVNVDLLFNFFASCKKLLVTDIDLHHNTNHGMLVIRAVKTVYCRNYHPCKFTIQSDFPDKAYRVKAITWNHNTHFFKCYYVISQV